MTKEETIPKNTDETRDKLARFVANHMSPDELESFVRERLAADYREDPCEFDEAWACYFGESV